MVVAKNSPPVDKCQNVKPILSIVVMLHRKLAHRTFQGIFRSLTKKFKRNRQYVSRISVQTAIMLIIIGTFFFLDMAI